MSTTRTKALIACGSALAAALVAWRFVRPTPPGTIDFAGDPRAVQDLLVERESRGARTQGPLEGDAWKAPLLREPIGPEDAPRLFTMPPQTFDYDAFTFYRYKPLIHERIEWAEYPGGAFEKRTNSMGMRKDGELPASLDALVVVTGDSHTDGLCANADSFASRIETGLRARHPGRTIEAVNTGVSGFSFANYLGAFEKFAERKPAACVVAFYGGNDFLEVLKPWHYFQRTAPPPRTKGYWARIEAARALGNVGVAMAYNQLVYFQYYPDQIDVALRASIQFSAEIARACAAAGSELVFVYIPPGFEVDGLLQRDVARAKELLELTDGDLQQYHRLADRLMTALRAHGVRVVDLRDHFVGDIAQYYWSDLHINLKGHELVADLVLAELGELEALAR